MAGKPGVTMTKDMADEVMKSFDRLTDNHALIGIPDANAGREPEEGEESEPISNAELGYVHEFGLPEKNIPARPFLIPGVRDAVDKLGNVLKAGIMKTMAGDKNAPDIALNKAGLIAQTSVRAKITDGPFQSLADRTLADRRRRGRTGEKPLIDTGQLRNSVTYVIRPVEED